MKLVWLVLVVAVAAASGPAAARSKHRAAPRCIDRPVEFSWGGILTNPKPEPNGCAPSVYVGRSYIGQDPDPNIRFQLRRDPATGYSGGLY